MDAIWLKLDGGEGDDEVDSSMGGSASCGGSLGGDGVGHELVRKMDFGLSR